MFDHARRQLAAFADFPVGGIVLELKREKFEREGVNLVVLGLSRRIPRSAGAGARRNLKVRVHAVFGCRLVFRHSREAL